MASLQDQYPDELILLQRLFGVRRVSDVINRLNEIHHRTEEIWRDYVRRLPGGMVKYLLIAEAPPWSAYGAPQYLLDPTSRPRTLMRALRGAFLGGKANEVGATLAELSRRGFLLVDSIPFPMDYSKKRLSQKYRDLVAMTARTYLMHKLGNPLLSWSTNVRVALCFRVNGEAVISALGGQLVLGRNTRTIGAPAISANASNYPDAKRLKEIYGLV